MEDYLKSHVEMSTLINTYIMCMAILFYWIIQVPLFLLLSSTDLVNDGENNPNVKSTDNLYSDVNETKHCQCRSDSEKQLPRDELSTRVQTVFQDDDSKLDLVFENDDFDINFEDLVDLDDYFTSDESMTDEEDDLKIKLSFEPLKETEHYLHNYPSLMQSRKDGRSRFTCRKHRSTRDSFSISMIRNGNQLHPDEDKVKNELASKKGRQVFCNSFSFDDYSYNLGSSELNSNSCSLTEGDMYDSLHVSNKVTTWSNSPDLIDGDYIDVMVNDIVSQYANVNQQPEDDSENSKKSKGKEYTVCKTINSQEAAVPLECTEELEIKKDKPKKRRKRNRRRRNKRKTLKVLRDIINWQTSLRRNPTVLYDVQPGTTNGRIEFHRMARSGSNENSEDSRGLMNGLVAEARPQNAVQSKSSIERDHLHANGVQETLEIPLGHQNGMVDNKSAQIVDNKSSQVIEEEDKERGASYSVPLQSASASNSFSSITTEIFSSIFDNISLLSVEEDEAFNYEWIRLKTFSDWPLTSIFSTTLARNGWVSPGEGDRARCYSCHIVHEGWRIGDDPNQYHSPNCRFKSGQSNNIPISRGTSNQTPNPGQISQDHQQFPSPALCPGNTLSLSGAASSVGHPGPVKGVSQQGLNRPQQDSFLPRESNIQQQETNLIPQENYPLPQGNLTRPQEIYPRPQETRETNTAAMIGNQNVTPSQQLSAGLPTSEVSTATTRRNTNTSRNTSTPTPQVPTDNLHSTAAAEAPSPHSKEAQLEALKRDPMGINFDRPKYPSYAILAVRISSYTDWPAAMTQTPRDMALAGFFYAGYGDYTRCFFCGGGLRNWEAGDDPWVEHARWFKKCAFVRQNRGQEFIDLVQKRAAELDEQGNQEEMGNQQTNTAISDPNSAQAKEEKVMRSPAVTTIKEMGYSEDKIKAAIHTIKSRLPRGKHKVSAQEILEVIFELNQSESGTPVGQSERVSENPTNSINQSDSTAENTAHHMGQSDPAPEGNQNSKNEAASTMEASNTDQTSLDDHENRNSLPNPIFDELTSLKQENSSLKDQILCKICMEKNVSIAFLPCGHLACCEDCAPAMRKCPICREFVRGTVKTFLV